MPTSVLQALEPVKTIKSSILLILSFSDCESTQKLFGKSHTKGLQVQISRRKMWHSVVFFTQMVEPIDLWFSLLPQAMYSLFPENVRDENSLYFSISQRSIWKNIVKSMIFYGILSFDTLYYLSKSYVGRRMISGNREPPIWDGGENQRSIASFSSVKKTPESHNFPNRFWITGHRISDKIQVARSTGVHHPTNRLEDRAV